MIDLRIGGFDSFLAGVKKVQGDIARYCFTLFNVLCVFFWEKLIREQHGQCNYASWNYG